MPAVYANAFVYIDGRLVAEGASVETSIEHPATEDIIGIAEGYAGTEMSYGVRVTTVDTRVPQDGEEIAYEKLMEERTKVELAIHELGEGKFVSSFGQIVAVTRNAAVGQNYAINFTHRGGAIPFTK